MPAGGRRRRDDDEEDGYDMDESDRRPRQRRTRDSTPEEEEYDEEETRQDNGDGDGDMDGEGYTMDLEAGPDQQLAKKLVRYAMACEFSRTPIRRDGIREKVLGDQGRAFRRVLEAAQKQLRDVWGMELRELPLREKHSLEEKRKAIRSQSQAKTSSGTYVLMSVLPEPYRTAAIITPSRTPSAEGEASYMAFYTLVVTVIMLNGGEVSDAKLRRYLHRLNAEDNVGPEPTEEVLKRMVAQGYVMKHVQRDETSQMHDSGENVTWYVGPRGQEEVGADGASGLVRAVWGPQEEQGGEELEKKIQTSFGTKPRANAEAGAAAEGDGHTNGAMGEDTLLS